MRSENLKQQDIVLAVHLLRDQRFRRQREYAKELGISQYEVSASLKRLIKARLLDAELKLPYRGNLKEFLIHGLKYAFPAKLGPVTKGVATATAAPPLAQRIRSSGLPFVWPSETGRVQGQAIEPLYPTVPRAVQAHPQLYELLALIDSIRLGKPREQAAAIEELEKRLS